MRECAVLRAILRPAAVVGPALFVVVEEEELAALRFVPAPPLPVEVEGVMGAGGAEVLGTAWPLKEGDGCGALTVRLGLIVVDIGAAAAED